MVFSITGIRVNNSTTHDKHPSSLRVSLMYTNVGDNYWG